jgi:hypothetical protein
VVNGKVEVELLAFGGGKGGLVVAVPDEEGGFEAFFAAGEFVEILEMGRAAFAARGLLRAALLIRRAAPSQPPTVHQSVPAERHYPASGWVSHHLSHGVSHYLSQPVACRPVGLALPRSSVSIPTRPGRGFHQAETRMIGGLA